MNTLTRSSKFAHAVLETQHQSAERVHAIVDQILKLGGCPNCGRAAIFQIDFVTDPPPDLAKQGVASIHLQGF